MCYDPWEEGIYNFANLYIEAVNESNNPRRTETHRRQWAGRAEGFEKSYPNKLEELDDDELIDWLNDIESDWSGEEKERLIGPAGREQKRRAEGND